jgi:predicted metal-dependent phosphoesterase TrpH
MALLRGNLHAHTTFSDGVRSPTALIEEYEKLGYDFLAITDHENWIPTSYWRSLDHLSARLLLFHGVELNWDGFEQHVGEVRGDRETLYVLNHPARYRLTVAETLDRIRTMRAGGLTLDAVEVTDTGLYRPVYDTDEIGLVKVATDDAHRPPHFGRGWIEVDAARDRDAIIRAIRAGDFRIGLARSAP